MEQWSWSKKKLLEIIPQLLSSLQKEHLIQVGPIGDILFNFLAFYGKHFFPLTFFGKYFCLLVFKKETLS